MMACAETATDFKGCIIVRKGLEGAKQTENTGSILDDGVLTQNIDFAVLRSACVIGEKTEWDHSSMSCAAHGL